MKKQVEEEMERQQKIKEDQESKGRNEKGEE
jgi:hypothetical protein